MARVDDVARSHGRSRLRIFGRRFLFCCEASLMEKRVTLAFVICFLFIMGYPWLMAKLYPPPPKDTAATAEVSEPAKTDTPTKPAPSAEPTSATQAGTEPPF